MAVTNLPVLWSSGPLCPPCCSGPPWAAVPFGTEGVFLFSCREFLWVCILLQWWAFITKMTFSYFEAMCKMARTRGSVLSGWLAFENASNLLRLSFFSHHRGWQQSPFYSVDELDEWWALFTSYTYQFLAALFCAIHWYRCYSCKGKQKMSVFRGWNTHSSLERCCVLCPRPEFNSYQKRKGRKKKFSTISLFFSIITSISLDHVFLERDNLCSKSSCLRHNTITKGSFCWTDGKLTEVYVSAIFLFYSTYFC